ncbi:inactive cytochrome P450 76AD1-like [Prosopis cineraria]|uniref:inactive cytochrome P450 76AD1-like n=1 Tax=Prosopis cineraria TaxID=364024 RepID=UPI00240FECC5|nr:inactive cytochrome P450 76AD1-like [Prosopis cineraria]
MDNFLALALTSIPCASFLIYKSCFVRSTSSSSYKLPPGPRPYPVIGNILELGSNPLLSITNLSKSHGPIISLKLGTRIAIIISSQEIAGEAFHKHDLDFSSRTFPDSARALNHYQVSIAWPPVSTQWRALRRACVMKIFSNLKLDST